MSIHVIYRAAILVAASLFIGGCGSSSSHPSSNSGNCVERSQTAGVCATVQVRAAD